MVELIQSLFDNYWQEFLLIASAHLLAVASPGPDFAIVMRQSLIFGRRPAIVTSIGIGLAILVHVAIALVGVGALIKSTPWLFTSIKIAGALYLGYIGLQAIRAQKSSPNSKQNDKPSQQQMPLSKAFRQGFMTNVLNPKATLFFFSLFTSIISTSTPIKIQLVYGIWMAFATAAWFVSLSFLLSQQKVRGFFANYGYWIDRILGAFLIGLAIMLLFAKID
ncbi:LysE family translocator [Kangiella sp. TOML190]|uniref:LysE family translocator n=1 Tax=Kangiella sp. TOML190 TaxID=2931351 RepID=UPI00204268D8|nr:LysE family translocator [Kangiella sp. TOML190]